VAGVLQLLALAGTGLYLAYRGICRPFSLPHLWTGTRCDTSTTLTI